MNLNKLTKDTYDTSSHQNCLGNAAQSHTRTILIYTLRFDSGNSQEGKRSPLQVNDLIQ